MTIRPIIYILPFLFCKLTTGQIKTVKFKEKIDSSLTAKYDSLTNFVGENVNKFLGQELFLNQKPESLRKYGYEGFFSDYTKDRLNGGVYKCCDNFNSKYEDLAGKYFTVLEVKKHPEASEMPYLYGTKYFLKLQENESKDTLYYEYDSGLGSLFPFIFVGYFEKIKKTNIGRVFVFQNDFINGSLDLETGAEVFTKTGEKWTCYDVIIEGKFYYLSLAFKNQKGEKIAIEYERVAGNLASTTSFSTSKSEYYKKKFGSDNWETILLGKVKIGMTKEMCRVSWGEPKKINEIITANSKSEQWVYHDNYLYFKNGILTAIQYVNPTMPLT